MRSLLNEVEVKELLSAYGIAVPKEAIAGSEEESLRIAEEIGYPVVLKSVATDIKSRSASGCMALGVSSKGELEERFREITGRAKVKEILVQETLPSAREVVIGMMRDDALGPVVMFSLGGVFFEVIKDISFRAAPIKREEALAMVKEIKAYQILEGSREGGASDIAAIVEVIEKVSEIGMKRKDVLELEINPLFVYCWGAIVVSAKGVIERKE